MPLVTRNTGAGNIYVDSTQPSDVTNGTIWIDTSSSPPEAKVADGSSYSGVVNSGASITIGGLTTTLGNFLVAL